MIESNSLSDFRETHSDKISDFANNLKDIIQSCLFTPEDFYPNYTNLYAYLNWNFFIPGDTDTFNSKLVINLQQDYEHFHQLGYGYLNAAYVLLNNYLNTKSNDQDIAVFCIFFNIQQGIELYLKSFLIYVNSKQMQVNKEIWDYFKSGLAESDRQVVENIENIVFTNSDNIVVKAFKTHNLIELFNSFENSITNNLDDASKKNMEVVRLFLCKYSDFVSMVTVNDIFSCLHKTKDLWEQHTKNKTENLDIDSHKFVDLISKRLSKLVNDRGNFDRVDYMWMRYTHTTKGVIQKYANSPHNIRVNLLDLLIILVTLYDALEHIYDGVIYMD